MSGFVLGWVSGGGENLISLVSNWWLKSPFLGRHPQL